MKVYLSSYKVDFFKAASGETYRAPSKESGVQILTPLENQTVLKEHSNKMTPNGILRIWMD